MASGKLTPEQKYHQATEDVPGLHEPQRTRLVAHTLATNAYRETPVATAAVRLAAALIGASGGQTSVPAAMAEAEAILGLPKYGATLAGLQEALIALRKLNAPDIGNRLLVGSVRRYCEHVAREAAALAARLSN
jgi:hypothetical protein